MNGIKKCVEQGNPFDAFAAFQAGGYEGQFSDIKDQMVKMFEVGEAPNWCLIHAKGKYDDRLVAINLLNEEDAKLDFTVQIGECEMAATEAARLVFLNVLPWLQGVSIKASKKPTPTPTPVEQPRRAAQEGSEAKVKKGGRPPSPIKTANTEDGRLLAGLLAGGFDRNKALWALCNQMGWSIRRAQEASGLSWHAVKAAVEKHKK